jgi:hypothetical protein
VVLVVSALKICYVCKLQRAFRTAGMTNLKHSVEASSFSSSRTPSCELRNTVTAVLAGAIFAPRN